MPQDQGQRREAWHRPLIPHAPGRQGELAQASARFLLWCGQVCFPDGACPLQAISNKEQHSISYTLSRAHTVVVEYTHDGGADMFQVRTT